MKQIAISIMRLAASTSLSMACDQVPEMISYKGKTERMRSFPLGQYFKNGIHRPQAFKPCHTACWRGYVGTWEIKDGLLYLVALRTDPCEGEPQQINLSEVNPEWKSPVMVSWFNGVIKKPRGTGIDASRTESLHGDTEILDFRNGELYREGTTTWREAKNPPNKGKERDTSSAGGNGTGKSLPQRRVSL